MKKTTLEEIRERFTTYNKTNNIQYGSAPKNVSEISAVIVYRQDNFSKPYSETERSYRVTNLSGKFFFEGMLGRSIWGDCLDGKDLGVRLDAYPWKIEYCYFEN